jgi:hypothetical protein
MKLSLLLACLGRFSQPAAAQSNNAAAYTWTTFAGYPGTGSADGIGSAAEFNNPTGIAVDSAGNVYVADTYNYTIRRITPGGLVSTFAGSAGIYGGTDGTGRAALFSSPQGLAADSSGNVYVADSSVIRKITPTGVVSTIAGGGSLMVSPPDTNYLGTNLVITAPPTDVDGPGTNATFFSPQGLAVDSAGNVYVADTVNQLIRKIAPVGTNWIVSTIAGNPSLTNAYGLVISGSADGTGTNAQFDYPKGVAVDSAGNLYVADTLNNTIRKMTPAGTNWMVTTIAGQVGVNGINGMVADGMGTNATFNNPTSIAMDSAGNLYVADTLNNTIRKMTPAGTNWVVSTLAGSAQQMIGSADGTGTNAQFFWPSGVAVDGSGNIYVADTGNNKIRKIRSAGVVSTLAGLPGSQGSVDGTGNNARFSGPSGAAVDSTGNLYVGDVGNNTIREVTSLGEVSTMAGQDRSQNLYGGSADGVGSEAQFNQPSGVAVDINGNVFVADTANSEIRMVTQGGVVSTIAGNTAWIQLGSPIGGSVDGMGTNAQFYFPYGVAVDGAGNLYVADTDNSTIRKITPVGTSWVVTTIAGNALITNSIGEAIGGSADGTGTNAQFDFPGGIAVDRAGNLYVADSGNNTIRKITPTGTNWVVTTIAGLAGNYGSADGTGTNAMFNAPFAIAVDSAGTLYVAEYENDTIRKITPVGTNWVVSTIGGLTGSTGSTDGAGSAARFNHPEGIAVDNMGNIYVVDSGNNTIREGVFTEYTAVNQVHYTPPSMNGQLVVTLLPPEANGQWRFPWEAGWRNSGQTANNLVAGNYPVQFRNQPGYVVVPLSGPVPVTNNGTTFVTNQYYPTFTTPNTNQGGSLTVNIGPSPPSGVGWRFLGDTTAFLPSGYTTNLAAGTYLIEFASVSGFSKPPNLSVQVFAGQPTVLSETYLLAQSAPAGVLLPTPVPANNITDLADYPFGFNGQLQTDIGYGSGAAVQTNVVLTAAHMVFNDQTLSYVSQAYWFIQQEKGVFVPEPLPARGWYLLSGYAAQRTNDVLGGLGPEQSSPQSRNMDVAALYFLSPVAGGGYGGFLPSDTVPNQWLASTSLKMLVGYPVDGSQFGDASIVPGTMYATDPQPYPLSQATDPVADQQVYTANWFLSYPGNSGGPFYVQFNGYYYPAGVYLGTLYNGIVPYASAVRAIDSDVVNLITLAATQGDSGTNNSGGVITLVVNQPLSTANPAYVMVQLGPPAAIQAGAGWRLSTDPANTYLSGTNSVDTVTTTNATLVFKSISGWNPPTNQTVSLTRGGLTIVSNALYTVISSTPTPPVMVIDPVLGLGITGTTGTTYQIQSCNSLANNSWTAISTNTIISTGFNLVLPPPFTNGAATFYRAKWLP